MPTKIQVSGQDAAIARRVGADSRGALSELRQPETTARRLP
ncbi:MAG: hypothetical protein V3U29_10965 [Phycisphaeraceae bacterium]